MIKVMDRAGKIKLNSLVQSVLAEQKENDKREIAVTALKRKLISY